MKHLKKLQNRMDLTLLEWALILSLVCVIWAGVADLYRSTGGFFGG